MDSLSDQETRDLGELRLLQIAMAGLDAATQQVESVCNATAASMNQFRELSTTVASKLPAGTNAKHARTLAGSVVAPTQSQSMCVSATNAAGSSDVKGSKATADQEVSSLNVKN